MRALLRVLFVLVVLGALSGCSDSEREARKAECADWVSEHRGGSCRQTYAELEEEAARDEADYQAWKYMEEQKRNSGSSSRSTTNAGVFDPPSVYNGGDLDCEDFGSRSEAQAYLEANPADADYLDGDGDGLACEWGT
jgi:hypothetical protein